MPTISVNMIFLGNFPAIDIDESNQNTENAASLAGTYLSFVDGLELVTVDNFDANGDGRIWDDEMGNGDRISYTTSGGSVSMAQVDASVSFSANVTDLNGVVHPMHVLVVQAVNGDVLLGDLGNSGALDNLTIRAIELIAPVTTNAAGYTATYNVTNTSVCFGIATLIETERGYQRVDQLRPGDRVATVDRGLARINRVLRAAWPAGRGLPPVRIGPGALAPGLPRRALELTAQHRVMVASAIADRMFGVPEVLVPAHLLTVLPGVRFLNGRRKFDSIHLLLPRHELVLAEGVPAETLLPGALSGRGAEQARGALNPVRPMPEAARLRTLLHRHKRNGLALLSGCGALPPDAGQF
ncbi:MAG: Hint domain-containing protein [Roseivivax sp.]|nr:Hint domain-containing protein [Roseivivax sp.]